MAPLRLQTLLSLPPSLRSVAALRILQPTLKSPLFQQPQSHQRKHQSTNSSSVNQSEISHFTHLASSWWDPQGSSRLLHLMNPLRHDFIARCRQDETAGMDDRKKLHYLDIGCGGGIFAESAARKTHTASVTAIDPTPDVIAVAKRHQRLDPTLLQPGRLEYRNVAIEDLSTSTKDSGTGGRGGYDMITLFEVLEHIQHPTPFLSTVLSHLKPGGWLIGSTIARTNTSWFTTKFLAEDVMRLVPRGTHEWSQYIQPHELREWARVQGELEGWEVMGVVYVPGFGWKEVEGSEGYGNYFFGVRKQAEGRG